MAASCLPWLGEDSGYTIHGDPDEELRFIDIPLSGRRALWGFSANHYLSGVHSQPVPVPAEVFVSVGSGAGLQHVFAQLFGEWNSDTAFTSSIQRIAIHPAYQRIIGLGPAVLPYIFEHFQTRPVAWLWALNALAGHDAAEGAETVEEATTCWLSWAADKGLLRSNES